MSKIFKYHWDVLIVAIITAGFALSVYFIESEAKQKEKVRCENLKENNITSSECKGVI